MNAPNDNPQPVVPDAPSPRAFASACGFVFQAVGATLFLASCCLWAASDKVFQIERGAGDAGFLTQLADAGSAMPVVTLGMVLTLVGGLGLAATGIGLQGERPRSGGAGMIAAGFFTAAQVVVAGLLIQRSGAWAPAIMPGLLAVIGLVLFMMAGYSRQLIRRFPPPTDQSRATDEFLREVQRRPRI
jgi:hypothetical protein